MKKIFNIIIVTVLFISCGNEDDGTSSNDVQSFCDCVKNPTKECEAEMEKLEEEFKKDEARYKKFSEEAMKSCPDAEKYIKRMN